MKSFVILFICILLQPVLMPTQKGLVKGKLGEELDTLMSDLSKEGYSGAERESAGLKMYRGNSGT